MRIFHVAHRQKNPSRRGTLRGAKKQVQTDLMRVLKNPTKPGRRRKNPGESIEAFNLLGELQQFIEEEARKAGSSKSSPSERKEARRKVRNFMALRDIVRARIEGHLNKGALDYSLQEAMRDLTAAEVRIVRKMIDESGGEASPDEGSLIRSKARQEPEVQRLLKRAQRAERVEEETRKIISASIRRGKMSPLEWGRGEKRHGEIRDADTSAREELGDESYSPADRGLWTRVGEAIKKKYPEGYIPPRLKSTKNEELALLIEMNHRNTSAGRRKEIRSKLENVFRNRLKTKTILAYEKAGGRAMTESEKKRLKRSASQKMQRLGEPFQVSPGFYGMVTKSNGEYKWALVDHRGRIHFSGKATTKNSASKNIGISFRILETLVMMDESRVGWDELPENDRRWLESNYPEISEKIARLMLKNINKRIKVRKETALWIGKAGGLGSFSRPEKQAEGCENMNVGDERVIKGIEPGYSVHVRRGAGSKYTMWVVTSDGRSSQPRRFSGRDGCETAVRRGHALGGAMAGAGRVAKAISNPSKVRKLNSDARRYFARANPSLPREAAEEADIKELAGMVQIPYDNKKAFQYGLYIGIIRGIDTCGVQNYLKRKRIRKRYQEKILEGFMTTASREAGLSGRKKKKSRSSSEEEFDDILESLDAL